MANDRKILYSIILPLLLLLSAVLLIPTESSRVIAAALLLSAVIPTYFFVKKRSILSINKNQVILLMGLIALLSVMLYYVSGLYFGFEAPLIKFSGSSFLTYILPITLIIIASEIIRAAVHAQECRAASVIAFFICLLADILTVSNFAFILSFNRFMELVGLTVFPAITSNLLYHYLSKRYGILPNTVYRLVISLFPYIIPFDSAIPDSLYAFGRLLIPLLVHAFIYALYERKQKATHVQPKPVTYIGVGLASVVVISVAMLISCQFKFGMIVIATESMTGELDRGDAIIYEDYDGQKIEIEQVIVFNKNDSRTVHRVVGIETVNGVTRYYTKGDANEENDAGYITRSQIIGIVRARIPYIGYPTLWLRDIFIKKGEVA